MSDKFNRATQRFYAAGLDLVNPLDNIKERYFPVLENLRSNQLGWLQPRPGLVDLGAVGSGVFPVHTIRRLNNPADNTWTYLVGVGTELRRGQSNPFSIVAYDGVGLLYSGAALKLIPYRPDQSIGSWMYIADELGHAVATSIRKMFKVGLTGVAHQIGLPTPQDPPNIRAANLLYGEITNKTNNTVGWNVDNVLFPSVGVGAPTLAGTVNVAPRVNKATTTVAALVFDSGTSGWASVTLNPVSTISHIGSGTLLEQTTATSTVNIMVHSMHPGSSTSVAVASIIYDNGVSGMCTVVPTKALDEFDTDVLVLINGQYSTIKSVVRGPDETLSFRLSLNAGVTAAMAIQVVSSFRTFYPAVNAASGDNIGKVTFQWTNNTGAGVGTTGWIDITTAIDLTSIPPYAGGPEIVMTDDDYIHLSLYVSDLSKISQGRIIFNCDKEATPTYEKNFYYRAFTPNDLVPVAQGLKTALDGGAEVIRRQQIRNRPTLQLPNRSIFDDYNDPSRPFDPTPGEYGNDGGGVVVPEPSTPRSQTGTGKSQWHEIRFKRKDLVRVGTDSSRGFANINGFRLEITFAEEPLLPLNVVTFAMDSLSVWGSGSLDSGSLGIPYYYRTRFRCSSTGVRSDYSPATFGGIVAYRENIIVEPSETPIANEPLPPEIDKIDIERYGGTSTNWLYVGTVDVGNEFTDQVTDDNARANAKISEGDLNAQPWVTLGAPITGTVSVLAGTMLTLSSAIPRDLKKGTGIKIERSDGSFVHTAFRRSLFDTKIEVDDHVGYGAVLAYEIAEPVYVGRPLPAMWGMWRGRMWACGDDDNPGTLYYSELNNPDATQQGNLIEITAPSEPLVHGCIFNDRNYVFSSEQMFEIIELGQDQFGFRQVPNGRGLWHRNGLCVADRIWFLSRDGIYQSGGAECVSITDETIRPLFPMEGTSIGIATNGFNPVYMTPDTYEVSLQLNYYKGMLYFDYWDNTASKYRTLVYDTKGKPSGWFADVFTPGIVTHYGAEGESVDVLLAGSDSVSGTGHLYQVTGTTDAGTAIPWMLQSPAFDANDRRASKRWGDLVLDVDPAGSTVNITAGVNNSATGLALTPVSTASATRLLLPVEIGAGEHARGRNISLALSGSGAAKLYFWEPSWLVRPEGTYRRATDYDLNGQPICKYIRGFYLECDTFGVAKSFTLRGDEGAVLYTGTANHAGKSMKYYPITPAYAYETSILGTDDDQWDLYDYRLDYDPAPPLSDSPQTWDEFATARFVQGCLIDGDTSGANVNVQIEVDEGVIQTTIQAGSNQGPVNLNGRAVKAYSFDTPFITHLIRANPASQMRLWKVTWIFEPEPELATNWKTQQTSHGKSGYQHLKDGYITLMSTATVTLKIIRTDDGTQFTYTIPSTAGQRKKVYVPFGPIKGRAFQYELTSQTGFRLYKNDCEVRVKQWASEEQFSIENPFGAAHGDGAARI